MRVTHRVRWGLGLLLMVAACSSTKVTHTWKEPTWQGPPVKKVLVVGRMSGEEARRELEDRFASELEKKGVKAVPSHRLLPKSAQVTRDAVSQVVEQEGFDAVLSSTLLSSDTETQEVPPGTADFYRDYIGSLGPTISPTYGGYAQEISTARVETNLYDARQEGKLVWSATSETIQRTTAEKAAVNGVGKLVKRLHEDGLL